MFNGYMLEKLPFQMGSFFTYVMYITARVSHLHENGRLSERDKPTASSRDLDAVFGIPSSEGFFLLSCIYFPNNHSGPSSVDYLLSVQGLLKYLLQSCLPEVATTVTLGWVVGWTTGERWRGRGGGLLLTLEDYLNI